MKKTLISILVGGIIWFMQTPYGFMLGYDTDKDGIEDTRKVYVVKGRTPEGAWQAEHVGTYMDTNKDGQFTEDERVEHAS